MKNRATVTIAEQKYMLVDTEGMSYAERATAHVDARVEEVLGGAHVSPVDGAILAVINIADEYFEEVEVAENPCRQFRKCLEEVTRMKLELSGARRETFELQNKK